jgi:superfamily II DNA or RNA helicase
MKFLLDNALHLPAQLVDVDTLRERLTIKPKKLGERYTFAAQSEQKKICAAMLDPETNTIAVPRTYGLSLMKRSDFSRFNQYLDDRTVAESAKIDIPSRIVPRSGEQEKAVAEAYMNLQNSPYSGVIEGLPGSGKTVVLLQIASMLGCRTLVLVHSRALMMQWIDAIKGHLHVSENEIGIARQGRHDGPGKAIVVGLVQSVVKDKYGEGWKRQFGTVILDECDLFPTKVFQLACGMFPARYRLAGTATLERKDGMSRLLDWHIGRVIARMMTPDVIPEVYEVEYARNVREKSYTFNGKVSYTILMRILSMDEGRNECVVDLAWKAYKGGRKILVLAHHKAHLRMLRTMFEQANHGHTALWKAGRVGVEELHLRSSLFTGDQKGKELEDAKKMPVIFGTYKMLGRGVDIPDVDALIFAAPIADVRQAAGRTLRQHPDKKNPIIVDIVDTGIPVLVDMYRPRVKWYGSIGCEGRYGVLRRQQSIAGVG